MDSRSPRGLGELSILSPNKNDLYYNNKYNMTPSNYSFEKGDSQYRLPSSPVEPKPTSTKSYIKHTQFTSYNMIRPKALMEITELIESNLLELNKRGRTEVSKERLSIYKSALDRYIEETHVYKPLLTKIKDEYELMISYLMRKLELYRDYDAESARKDDYYSQKIEEMKNLHSTEELKLFRNSQQLESEVKRKMRDYIEIESENKQIRESNIKILKEYEGMKVTCLALTNSLSKCEDEKKRLQSSLVIKESENAVNRLNINKLGEEIERLQQVIHTKDQLQSNLVPQEEVSKLEKVVSELHSNQKLLEDKHRQVVFMSSICYTLISS